MNLDFSPEQEQFRKEIRSWLEKHLTGEFEKLRFRGGPGDEHIFFEERCRWEKQLARGNWTGTGWPVEHGGRALGIAEQVVFHEEYARQGAPGRVGHIGETLAGPTIIACGNRDQQQRFLPGILSGDELWCQGYSEPAAGSDLSNIKTRARLDNGEGKWLIHGQKLWTSLAEQADYCFVIARCEPDSVGRAGLCYLLVPMDQPGIEVRGIRQMTGTAEFCEVFFDGAKTAKGNIVGKPGEGWSVAMATLAFERGVSTLGQQMHFVNEFRQVLDIARANGAIKEPELRQRLVRCWIDLRIMRFNSLRILSDANRGALPPEAMIAKLYWASWHRDFGKLALDVMGQQGQLLEEAPYKLSYLQSMALFSRADTIYAGTNQIQRNIIAERALGMPKEPRNDQKGDR